MIRFGLECSYHAVTSQAGSSKFDTAVVFVDAQRRPVSQRCAWTLAYCACRQEQPVHSKRLYHSNTSLVTHDLKQPGHSKRLYHSNTSLVTHDSLRRHTYRSSKSATTATYRIGNIEGEWELVVKGMYDSVLYSW